LKKKALRNIILFKGGEVENGGHYILKNSVIYTPNINRVLILRRLHRISQAAQMTETTNSYRILEKKFLGKQDLKFSWL
jgi:hypothetical protein